MKQEMLLGAYEKLAKLVSKLPGPLQKAILSEMEPVKELFLEQRSARILITGPGDVSRVEIVNSLFREQIIPLTDVGQLPIVPGWETFRRVAGGSVLILDARQQTNLHWGSGRDIFPPDVVLFVSERQTPADQLQTAVSPLEQALIEIETQFQQRPAVFGVVEDSDGTPLKNRTPEEFAVESALRASPTVRKHLAQVLSIPRWSRFRADGTPDEGETAGLDILLTQLVGELPNQARLEMARISGVRPAQKKIAETLVKATAAVSAAVGAQPIPLADMPILTTLQTAMAAGIIYISGGELNMKSGLKFLGSLGASIGLGFVLRETARSAAKLVPGFGYAVSGAVAAGGTMAVGRAAIAFFIDGMTLPETKKIFRRKRKTDASLSLPE